MTPEPRLLPFPKEAAPPLKRVVLVTSYVTGAPEGQNLGCPGYSYDFVARLFAPLIEAYGELSVVPRDGLNEAVAQARAQGVEPIHLSFLPLQDVVLADDAPNVVVPAWEFPDIPDHSFDDKPENNWVEMAARCDLLIVGGPFTMEAFRRAGVRTPIEIVQVPTPDDYFRVPFWDPQRSGSLTFGGHTLSCTADGDKSQSASGMIPSRGSTERLIETEAGSDGKMYARVVAPHLKHAIRSFCKRSLWWVLPKRLHFVLKRVANAGICAWRETRQGPAATVQVMESPLDLSGIVYTSIFNPRDSRKNWEDLITGFLCAMKDHEDATLVLKLITNQPRAVDRVKTFCRRTGIQHRCKVVLVPDFLTDQQLIELAEATTYYVTTTRAEGNCLPLLNYLAAGRPGISPCHTAIADYFGRDVGLVVESHPEPAAFPQDRRLRKTTTWHRLVWPSLFKAFSSSYEMAKNDRGTYQRLAQNAREKISRWNSMQTVGPRLHKALNSVLPISNEQPKTPQRRLEAVAA